MGTSDRDDRRCASLLR